MACHLGNGARPSRSQAPDIPPIITRAWHTLVPLAHRGTLHRGMTCSHLMELDHSKLRPGHTTWKPDNYCQVILWFLIVQLKLTLDDRDNRGSLITSCISDLKNTFNPGPFYRPIRRRIHRLLCEQSMRLQPVRNFYIRISVKAFNFKASLILYIYFQSLCLTVYFELLKSYDM